MSGVIRSSIPADDPDSDSIKYKDIKKDPQASLNEMIKRGCVDPTSAFNSAENIIFNGPDDTIKAAVARAKENPNRSSKGPFHPVMLIMDLLIYNETTVDLRPSNINESPAECVPPPIVIVLRVLSYVTPAVVVSEYVRLRVWEIPNVESKGRMRAVASSIVPVAPALMNFAVVALPFTGTTIVSFVANNKFNTAEITARLAVVRVVRS